MPTKQSILNSMPKQGAGTCSHCGNWFHWHPNDYVLNQCIDKGHFGEIETLLEIRVKELTDQCTRIADILDSLIKEKECSNHLDRQES